MRVFLGLLLFLKLALLPNQTLRGLKRNKYKYVVSARQNAPSLDLEGEWVAVGDLNNCVKAALLKSEDSEEKWLYCESEAKAAVASQIKQSFRKRFEEDLQKLTSALSRPIGRKNILKYLNGLVG